MGMQGSNSLHPAVGAGGNFDVGFDIRRNWSGYARGIDCPDRCVSDGLRDLRFNTLGEEILGVFVHGQIIDQVMSGHFLTRPDYAEGVEFWGMILLSAALILIVYKFGAIASGVLGVIIAGAGLAGSYFAFLEFRLLFDPVWPSIAAFAVFFACSAARYWQTESDQRFIRGAFKTFVSPNLVDSLALHPEALKLGGTRKECTFIFTDLAGFTSFVEKSGPRSRGAPAERLYRQHGADWSEARWLSGQDCRRRHGVSLQCVPGATGSTRPSATRL